MKREAVDFLTTEEQLSNRKACGLIGISRTTYQYKRKAKDDDALHEALTALTTRHPSIGFWQCCYRLWNKGLQLESQKNLPGLYRYEVEYPPQGKEKAAGAGEAAPYCANSP